MSKVWGVMISVSMLVALIFGNVEVVINSIMESGRNSVENVLELIGMMCFWSGIFNIFEKCNIGSKISSKFSKITSGLFKKNEITKEAAEYINMNISMNVIGIGNAATVNGIKAMEKMQEVNKIKDTPNDSMTTFVLLNTASLQLIPTNMIALRAMYNSTNPSGIVIPIWIVTMVSLIFGIVSIKILNKRI